MPLRSASVNWLVNRNRYCTPLNFWLTTFFSVLVNDLLPVACATL